MSVVFDAMFLDHIATDIEHLQRLNGLLERGHIVQPDVDEDERIRPVSAFVITPSESLSEIAAHHQREMPYLIKYFVHSLGRDAASSADLMSYLLFTPTYTRDLIEIGYHDADKQIDAIENFLYSSDGNSGNGTGKSSASGVVSPARRK